VADLDHVDARRVERRGDRGHLLDAQLVALGVGAVAEVESTSVTAASDRRLGALAQLRQLLATATAAAS